MNKDTIFKIFSADKKIGKLVQSFGMLPELNTYGSAFEALCKSIVSQQLSTSAAATIYSRFSEMIGDISSPELIIKTPEDHFRMMGFSHQKATYIKNVCEYWLEKNIDDKLLQQYEDHEIIEFLTKIKGVGEWTVQMLLIFHFHRPNVLPLGDLIVRNGIIHFYQLNPHNKYILQECREVTQHWQPYCSFGSRYMWAFKDILK